MANIIIDLAAEFTGAKAFKKADNATDKLTRSVKKLGAAFGVTFGLQGAKMAVQAFAADEKAAKTLSQTLNNLGLAFADPAVKTFISDLEKQYGVLDDFLRPAYQKLITTTGDYLKAQSLLKTSLDLAAMSGQDVVTVSNDLAKAYAGNTKGLIKYGLGLSKTEIQAMSFEEILARIAEVSQGQAEVAANSYAGALGRLQVAGANASEILGKDLIQALTTLGGEGGLPKTLGLIESIASAVGDATIGFARLVKMFDIVMRSSSPLDAFRKIGAFQKEYRAADAKERRQYGGVYAQKYLATAQKNAPKGTDSASVKTQKALTKAQQDALKLAKAKAVFDLQKIQIEAALKGKISEEERLRLKLMQAIVDEDTSSTEKLTKQLEAAQAKTKEVSDQLATIKSLEIKDPFGTWQIDPLTAAINALTTSIGGVGTQIQASGREWSSFANLVATTVIRPNLTEWSSSFSAANKDAADASLKAIADAAAANAAAIKKAQDEAAATLKRLKEDEAASNAEAIKAAQDAMDALNKSASEQIAAFKAAAAKAAADAAAAAAASSAGNGDALARFRANEAANAASSSSSSGNTVIVHVEGSVLSENDLATVVNDAINNSSWAGNAIGYNRSATVMQAV